MMFEEKDGTRCASGLSAVMKGGDTGYICRSAVEAAVDTKYLYVVI